MALNHEIAPDAPTLYVPSGLYVGRGTTDEGIHIEGFLLMDGHIHYYNVQDGQEVPSHD